MLTEKCPPSFTLEKSVTFCERSPLRVDVTLLESAAWKTVTSFLLEGKGDFKDNWA